MDFVIELFTRTFVEAFYLLGTIILIGMLLGILRTYSIRNFYRSFGSKAVMITGFIGVPIHEISHAIFAILFGHKVTQIKLLQKPDANGIMGYVNHSYNQNSIYQQIGNFFIGVAPMFGGAISIITLMRFIIPQAYSRFISILEGSLQVTTLSKAGIAGIVSSYEGLIKSIFSFNNFENPYFYIFLFTSICISSHISLSPADIKGAYRGVGVIFFIILLFNIFGLSKYILAISIIRYNILITAFLTIAVILSIITFGISLILLAIKKSSL